MAFWNRLFGGGSREGAANPAHEENYKGFLVKAAPVKAGSEYQLIGTVEREVGGVRREHKLIRVDRFASFDEAVAATLAKGRQVVDEQGDRLFP